jgi:dynein assembly factor 2
MEDSGDLPPGTALIQPETGFCMKTSVKKLVSERTMKYFDQKCFINVCFHDSVPKAEKTAVRGPDGSSGFDWRLPHRVSKLRNDQDQNKELVSTYDVVYHSDIKSYMVYPDFQKFVADTALDGVGKVLQETKEKVSLDYKIMKNMKCKGGKPALMTIKVQTDNPLIDNVDMDKV